MNTHAGGTLHLLKTSVLPSQKPRKAVSDSCPKNRDISRGDCGAWGQTCGRGQTKTYFVHCVQAGRVKIGRAVDVDDRLRELACGSPFPLTLAATIDGDFEAALHWRFREFRVHGEWFVAAPRLVRFINSINPEVSIPAIRPAAPAEHLPFSDIRSFEGDRVEEFARRTRILERIQKRQEQIAARHEKSLAAMRLTIAHRKIARLTGKGGVK